MGAEPLVFWGPLAVAALAAVVASFLLPFSRAVRFFMAWSIGFLAYFPALVVIVQVAELLGVPGAAQAGSAFFDVLDTTATFAGAGGGFGAMMGYYVVGGRRLRKKGDG